MSDTLTNKDLNQYNRFMQTCGTLMHEVKESLILHKKIETIDENFETGYLELSKKAAKSALTSAGALTAGIIATEFIANRLGVDLGFDSVSKEIAHSNMQANYKFLGAITGGVVATIASSETIEASTKSICSIFKKAKVKNLKKKLETSQKKISDISRSLDNQEKSLKNVDFYLENPKEFFNDVKKLAKLGYETASFTDAIDNVYQHKNKILGLDPATTPKSFIEVTAISMEKEIKQVVNVLKNKDKHTEKEIKSASDTANVLLNLKIIDKKGNLKFKNENKKEANKEKMPNI